MTKGISINIGLNTVNPKHYAGWDGQLVACENDAEDMADIAKSKGFDYTMILTKEATVENVTKNLLNAAQKLDPGDLLLLTYSGHGGQLEDKNNDEEDFIDETWCLYDRQFVDDELNKCLSNFKDGVRIFVLSDSCHSGTVVKAAYFQSKVDMFNSNIDKDGKRYRFAPSMILNRVYKQNRALYDEILSNSNIKETKDKVKASVILISGCADSQLSLDGTFNGLFTSNLLKVWNNGSFTGPYQSFHKKIVRQMPPDQTPNYFREGKYNSVFAKGIPFTI